MPDRSRRLPPLPAQPVALGPPWGGEHGTRLLREHGPSSTHGRSLADGGDETRGPSARGSGARDREGAPDQEDNPFAPPPDDAPDRPWRPRRPAAGSGSAAGHSGPGAGADPDAGSGSPGGGRSDWGTQWSDQQPGRAPNRGFGERPGNQGGPEGPTGQGGAGLRWDPTDPAQRRARYALLSGMWAFFFALFGWRDLALLLGALALYWGISSLRAKPRRPDPTAPAPAGAVQPSGAPPGGAPGGRPQATAAVSGLVTASLALALVAATYAAQLVYSDYYTCVNDALTTSAKHSCDHLLPENLRAILGAES